MTSLLETCLEQVCLSLHDFIRKTCCRVFFLCPVWISLVSLSAASNVWHMENASVKEISTLTCKRHCRGASRIPHTRRSQTFHLRRRQFYNDLQVIATQLHNPQWTLLPSAPGYDLWSSEGSLSSNCYIAI